MPTLAKIARGTAAVSIMGTVGADSNRNLLRRAQPALEPNPESIITREDQQMMQHSNNNPSLIDP